MNRPLSARLCALLAASALVVFAAVASAEQNRARSADAGSGELTLAQKIAWQIALERVCFSPGVIDGRPGPKTALATREFQRVRRLPITGKLDAATARLLGADPKRVATYHTITAADKSQVGPLPAGWLEKSKCSRLPYPSLLELVAEKYHCSRKLLATLNPGKDLARLKVGDRLIVPLIPANQEAPATDRLEINTSAKVIRAFAGDKLVGLFHCSVAAHQEKIPTRPARVIGITKDPTYRFSPSMYPEVKGIDRVLIIPPGPRNPVGLCWIGLSLPGYGIHGTPVPENIGKTGSHGCFRMTNWDALRLGEMVKPGTPVTFTRGR